MNDVLNSIGFAEITTNDNLSEQINRLNSIALLSAKNTNFGTSHTKYGSSVLNNLSSVIGRVELMTSWEWSTRSMLTATKGGKTYNYSREIGFPFLPFNNKSIKSMIADINSPSLVRYGEDYYLSPGVSDSGFVCLAYSIVDKNGAPKYSSISSLCKGIEESCESFKGKNRVNYLHELQAGDILTDGCTHVLIVIDVKLDEVVYSTEAPGVTTDRYLPGDLLFYHKLFRAKDEIDATSPNAFPTETNQYWEEVKENSYPVIRVVLAEAKMPTARKFSVTATVGRSIKSVELQGVGKYASILRFNRDYLSRRGVVIGSYTGG